MRCYVVCSGGGFTLNPEKVVFEANQIKYLGHLISSRGVCILPDRVQAIEQYPAPKNLRGLRRFLGMVGFYARFIPGYSDVAVVLHGLTKKGCPLYGVKLSKRRLIV